jgi:alpha-D-xyloside xylohydrolase
MEKRFLFIAVLLAKLVWLDAQLLKTGDGIVLKNFGSNTLTLSLEIISHNIVHVTASPSRDSFNTSALDPEHCPFALKVNAEEIILKTDSLLISINSKSGRITFKNSKNNIILQESDRLYKHNKEGKKYLWSITQEFNWETEESLYAFEETNGNHSNITGKQFIFLQSNTPCQYPLISSSKGYGILWLNNSLSKFCNLNDKNYLWSEKAAQVEYYFMYSPSANRLLEDYHRLTSALTENSKNSLEYTSKNYIGAKADETNNQ